MFESFQSVYYRTDIYKKIIVASPSIGRVLGYGPKEVKNIPFNNIFYDQKKYGDFLKKLRKAGRLDDYEIKLKKKNGEFLDDNEQENLGLLLKELFPNREITCVTIVHNPAGIQGLNFSASHEYAYFVYPKGGRFIGYQYRDDKNNDIRNFRDVTGESSLRKAAKNCFYPILIKESEIVGFGEVSPSNYHPEINMAKANGVIEVYPIDPSGVERKWRFARQTVEEIQKELLPKYLKQRKVWDITRSKNKFNYKTVWNDTRYFANNYGTQILNKILLPNIFSYPKSLYAVIDCIDAAGNNKKKLTVLDFFAGSGTTGHAILELNKVKNE